MKIRRYWNTRSGAIAPSGIDGKILSKNAGWGAVSGGGVAICPDRFVAVFGVEFSVFLGGIYPARRVGRVRVLELLW